jgi:hypothetical protein
MDKMKNKMTTLFNRVKPTMCGLCFSIVSYAAVSIEKPR